jgi:translation initiation factor IF-2
LQSTLKGREVFISNYLNIQDTVKEVKKGFECGITLANYSDIKVNDVIEAYEMVEVQR